MSDSRFIIKNHDIVVRFTCAIHSRRIDEVVKNLLNGDHNRAETDEKVLCAFSSEHSDVFYEFDNERIDSSSIRHQCFFFENTEYPMMVRGINEPLDYIDLSIAGHKRSNTGHSDTISSDHGELYGSLNFHNQVGLTDFVFHYRTKGDPTEKNLTFKTEVLSYKLDYRSDLRKIISDIEKEYAMLSLSFMRDTYLSFAESSTTNNSDLIWWQIFRSCYDTIISAAKMIIDRPKKRLSIIPKYERAERIAIMPRELENEYLLHCDDTSYLYRTEELILSHDTIENRFLKHILKEMLRRFVSVKHNLLSILLLDDEQKLGVNLQEIENELLRLNNHPFFRGIGVFRGFKQDSLVMKQSSGYKDIMRQWLILQCGYELADGIRHLEVKEISELYEIWCFIKVKNIVKKILEEKGQDVILSDGEKDVTNDLIPQLLYGTESNLLLMSNDGIELASVMYNAEVERERIKEKSAISGTESRTTIQRPDIVLRLSKTNDEIVYTYLFDAKYRIDDIQEGKQDVPPEDAINQMHRYRDAIYYMSDNQKLKKEVVGGYILFPGKVQSDMLEDNSDPAYYYSQSARSIGIGAFPLRPYTIDIDPYDSEQALETQIRKWLNDENPKETLLETTIPQKGLKYSILDQKTSRNVFTCSVRKTDVDYIDFREHKAKKYVIEKLSAVNLLNARYLMPMVGGEIDGYYEIKGLLLEDGHLCLKLGTYQAIGDHWTNVYQFMRHGELISFNDMLNLYEK